MIGDESGKEFYAKGCGEKARSFLGFGQVILGKMEASLICTELVLHPEYAVLVQFLVSYRKSLIENGRKLLRFLSVSPQQTN